jgi:hypothetical protein
MEWLFAMFLWLVVVAVEEGVMVVSRQLWVRLVEVVEVAVEYSLEKMFAFIIAAQYLLVLVLEVLGEHMVLMVATEEVQVLGIMLLLAVDLEAKKAGLLLEV